MKTILRTLLNKYSYFKLKKKLNISVGENSRVNYRSFDLKNNINCKFKIGNKSLVDSSFVFEKEGAIIDIGNNTFMGGSVLSCANKIKIGDNVHIAWNVSIFDHNSHPVNHILRRNDLPNLFMEKKNWDDVDISPTIICEDAWIGVNVVILKGIEIGAGAVVGAGSVVTKNVPPMTLVAGNPARVIKELKY